MSAVVVVPGVALVLGVALVPGVGVALVPAGPDSDEDEELQADAKNSGRAKSTTANRREPGRGIG
jgi:hypothetical protein